MKIGEITDVLERLAPLSYQEVYDNSGLIVGEYDWDTNGALICLDATPEVIEEAMAKQINLVIAHHPIVFKGLKRFNNANYVEKAVMMAIKHDIAIYACHTNLDNVRGGVNTKIAQLLNLNNTKILAPKMGLLRKLSVFVPINHTGDLLSALYKAGAGAIGNYSQCSFRSPGKGTFKGNEHSSPQVGQSNKYEEVEEHKVEVSFPSHLEGVVLMAMYAAHPYEEVAYHLTELSNNHQYVGSGVVGDLSKAVGVYDFLKVVKETFALDVIKHTELTTQQIKRVAVCGGSGGFLLKKAKGAKADIFITSDYKYHEYFDADGQIIIADIGHFESEQFTKDLIQEIISEKIPNFATYLSHVRTNPVFYYS